jgi:predicted O-methyltransferase YrrM
MPYRTPERLDAVKALRHVGQPGFVRALARTAADWDFAHAAPVPVVPVEALVEKDLDVHLRVGTGQFGETPMTDLVALSLLIAQAHPTVLFEFGTFTGLGTLHMALNAPDGIVHTLDLQPEERSAISGLDWEAGIEQAAVGSLYQADADTAARVRQHWGDSRRFDTSEMRGKVGFIFIDAAHSYEFVRSDTQKAIELAAPGATVVWHDYHRICPDVQRVVAEQVPRFAPVAVAGTSIAVMRLP